MPKTSSLVSTSPPQAPTAGDHEIAKRRRDHLRRIHPMTREQQMTLIEEARAARLRTQDH